MNNITEVFDRGSNNEFIRFLKYSQRSCSEMMSMTYIIRDIYKVDEFALKIYNMALEERKQIIGFEDSVIC